MAAAEGFAVCVVLVVLLAIPLDWYQTEQAHRAQAAYQDCQQRCVERTLCFFPSDCTAERDARYRCQAECK